MKVLVTGAGGQLGLELKELLSQKGYEDVALARKELDITDARAVAQALEPHSPDLVINAAAYTEVDGCETETELAYRANAFGPRNLAQLCERSGCELLHVSTNYVFDGTSERPYEPFDPPNPVSAYGRTKLAGEEYVKHLSSHWYVVRSAGLYGEGPQLRANYVAVGQGAGLAQGQGRRVQIPDLCPGSGAGHHRRGGQHLHGVYHLTNADSCSWYEFAGEIFELAGLKVETMPIPSSEYPLPAARPANGILSNLGSPELRHWREALVDYLGRTQELTANASSS